MRKRRVNHKHKGLLVIALAALLLAAGVWHLVELTRADPPPVEIDVTISTMVLGCGDGIVELGEDCDGTEMNGHTCATEGFLYGSISCQASCVVQTSACTMATPSGGGSTPVVPVSSTKEIFTGYASPESTVNIFKDGIVVATVTTDATGVFFAQINNVTNGNYIFGFLATDASGNASAFSTLNITASGGIATNVDMLLSPIMVPMISPGTTGNSVMMSGSTAPNASVKVSLYSPLGISLSNQTVSADDQGLYMAMFDASLLTTDGVYTDIDQASLGTLTSDFSLPGLFTVGAPVPLYMPGDYDENLRVNLVDFSIAMYWYKWPLTDAFKILELRHGNGDGLLNLIDISIMAYWWTG